MLINNTICAIATAPGSGAIATVRLSGQKAFEIAEKIFVPYKKSFRISKKNANTVTYGTIKEGDKIIDNVLLSIFKAPHSYTGEDSIEISCHGSVYIQQKIMQLLIKNGAGTARPGEFTQRAYLNGKMDLSQAEAVADLISSTSEMAHKIAVRQMRGGFSSELQELRNRLLNFISLIELELDFGEEDVEFANRKELKKLIKEINIHVEKLIKSFEFGNVIKEGIPVAIVGEPNVGKSTLLNTLLNEDKAIVSDIPGTTRDAIEDTISLEGILFRFIDTAGIRETQDTIENLGIERTMLKIDKAEIVILMIDANDKQANEKIPDIKSKIKDKNFVVVINKIDNSKKNIQIESVSGIKTVEISAKHKTNIDELKSILLEFINYSSESQHDTIITNNRHIEALNKAFEAGKRVEEGLETNISGDFLAQDIREIMNYLGEITGEFTTDEVLGNIFANFCIGK